MVFENVNEEGVLKRTYLAKTELYAEAVIDGTTKTLYGVGSMVNSDPDMAMKTALAEAIKKAFHQAGVALYLWDSATRDRIEQKKKLAGGSESALKQAVFALAKEKLGKDKPTASEVAKSVGLKVGELADKDALVRVLTEAGVL